MATITNAGMVLTTNTSGNVTWSTVPHPRVWIDEFGTTGRDLYFSSLGESYEVEVEFED